MEILIDNRFKLVTNRTGWEVYQYRQASKGPRQGQLDWFSEGHYDTLPWALRGAYRLMLHQGQGVATLEQLAGRIEEAERRIVEALERHSRPLRQSDVQELRPVAPATQGWANHRPAARRKA